jgi:hypothetical protein
VAFSEGESQCQIRKPADKNLANSKSTDCDNYRDSGLIQEFRASA